MRALRVSLRALAGLALVVASFVAAHATDWQAGAGDDWRRELELARAEGKVVVAGDPDLGRAISDAFKRDTGVAVEFLAGAPRDLAARVIRELRAHSVTVDVMTGGPANIGLRAEGLMKAIKPQLMLPGVTGRENWTDGHIKWVDVDQAYMFMGAEYVSCDPFYNSDRVKPEELQNWRDLMNPRFKGHIAAADPRAQGSGQATAAYIAHMFGLDFVRDLYINQQVTLTRDPRQLMDWLARGSQWIVIGASGTDLERFKKSGLHNLAVSDLADGPGSVLGGFSIAWEPADPPHPHAAAVFLNWYASKPGQEAFMVAKGTPTRRTDVDLSAVPDYYKRKPGRDYSDQYREEFLVDLRPKLEKTIEEAMGGR